MTNEEFQKQIDELLKLNTKPSTSSSAIVPQDMIITGKELMHLLALTLKQLGGKVHVQARTVIELNRKSEVEYTQDALGGGFILELKEPK